MNVLDTMVKNQNYFLVLLFWGLALHLAIRDFGAHCTQRSVFLCLLTGKMARFQFPGKPGKFSVRKRRVLASKLRDRGGKIGGAEITGRFIADFYAMVGDSDEEEVCLARPFFCCCLIASYICFIL